MTVASVCMGVCTAGCVCGANTRPQWRTSAYTYLSHLRSPSPKPLSSELSALRSPPRPRPSPRPLCNCNNCLRFFGPNWPEGEFNLAWNFGPNARHFTWNSIELKPFPVPSGLLICANYATVAKGFHNRYKLIRQFVVSSLQSHVNSNGQPKTKTMQPSVEELSQRLGPWLITETLGPPAFASSHLPPRHDLCLFKDSHQHQRANTGLGDKTATMDSAHSEDVHSDPIRGHHIPPSPLDFRFRQLTPRRRCCWLYSACKWTGVESRPWFAPKLSMKM